MTGEVRKMGLAAAVAAVAHAMAHETDANRFASRHLDKGEVAGLRRLDPDAPFEPAFYEVLLGIVEPALGHDVGRDAEKRWALLIHAMALMAPDPHLKGADAGAALAETGYAEARLERLLHARGETLAPQLVAMARFLRAKGKPIDWDRLAPLVLDPDGAAAESARRAVARAYWRHLHKQSKAPAETGDAA